MDMTWLQRIVYAIAYAVATAWFDARKAFAARELEAPTNEDRANTDRFRAAVATAVGVPPSTGPDSRPDGGSSNREGSGNRD